MTDVLRIGRKELTATEILEALESGNRVVIEMEFLGRTVRMAIREREGTYYCDTPIKLLTYDTEAEMRTCLERYNLARPDGEPIDADETGVSTNE